MATGQKVFRDINDNGNNGVNYAGGSSPKYVAGKGWDACTGLGSIDGLALLNAIRTS